MRVVKCIGLFLGKNIIETPAWRVINCDSTEFNNLCYIEIDTETFQCALKVLRKLIEKKGKKAVTNIPSNFSKHIHNIYLIEDIL